VYQIVKRRIPFCHYQIVKRRIGLHHWNNKIQTQTGAWDFSTNNTVWIPQKALCRSSYYCPSNQAKALRPHALVALPLIILLAQYQQQQGPQEKDAMEYLNEVKTRFQNLPQVLHTTFITP